MNRERKGVVRDKRMDVKDSRKNCVRRPRGKEEGCEWVKEGWREGALMRGRKKLERKSVIKS